MRIGIFILAAGRDAGGPETYEVQLIRSLAAVDSANEYFIYATGPEAEPALGPLPRNFTVRVLRPSLRPVSIGLTLPRWMARDRIDFFHATYAPPPFPARPFLFTMHCVSNFAHPEFYPTLKRWRLNALQRVGLRRAGMILCVSDYVAGRLRACGRVPGSRLTTIYNGAGTEFSPVAPEQARARVREAFGIEAPYVLYVGKLQARKNVIGLIRAYAEYKHETGTDAELVLAGRRVETSGGITEAVHSLGLERDVIELGYVGHPSTDPHSPLPHLYAAARMTVMPSFYEGFGIPVIEAMACGCPVIASNITSLPEIAGDAALLVDPRDAHDIGRAMVRLEAAPALRAELVRRGLARAGLFTWENCARRTLEAYRAFASASLSRG